MNKKRHLILSLSLIAATVGFIWINSALPGNASGELSGRFRAILERVFIFIHFPEPAAAFLLEHVRKLAHVTEYAVMGFELAFFWIGFRRGFQGFWNAFSTVLFIAICDETIQLLALSRGPQVTDVLLDSVSGLCTILFVYFVGIIISCIKESRE